MNVLMYSFYFSCTFTGVAPQVDILGDPEVYIDVGSVLNLTCQVRGFLGQQSPAFILWYHGDRVRKSKEKLGMDG